MNKVLVALLYIGTCYAMITIESFIETKEMYVNQIDSSTSELRLLKTTLDSQVIKYKIVNTVGNVAAIAGTLLLFTPYFFVGLGTIGAGTTASIGAGVSQYFMENETKENLTQLLEKEAAVELNYSKEVFEALNESSKGALLFIKEAI